MNNEIRLDQKKVLVTGGASFIGSHLTDVLLRRRAFVRVVDDFSSGKLSNLPEAGNPNIEIVRGDLTDVQVVKDSVKGMDVIFHLAAVHGGRGVVQGSHQAEIACNTAIDGQLFLRAIEAGVEKLVYTSSGCIYPTSFQKDVNKGIFLKENMASTVDLNYQPDGIYGFSKLMGEFSLDAYAKENLLNSAVCRLFTVYGPRGLENHSITAMVAKAFIRQDPFEIWGNGRQIRNWTYVDDIVSGLILTAEKINDATAVNLGTMESNSVLDVVHMVTELAGYKPELSFMENMPAGPINRVCDNTLAGKLLGWEPRVSLPDGVRRTYEWYAANHSIEDVRTNLERNLTSIGSI